MGLIKYLLGGPLLLWVLLVTGSAAVTKNLVTADCNDYFSKGYPLGRYQVAKQGTVLDPEPGLMWFRCNVGEEWNGTGCVGDASRFTWEEAESYAKRAVVAGFSDWRVPEIGELRELVEKQCVSPSINTAVFPSALTDIYWSSSENFWFGRFAWGLFFFNGSDFGRHMKSEPYFLFLVRDL